MNRGIRKQTDEFEDDDAAANIMATTNHTKMYVIVQNINKL